MSSNERLKDCERLRHLVLELTAHYPVLFQEAPSLLHLAQEVCLYQIELEVQNEELQAAHREIEAARQTYRDLYDFAPTAYYTLNSQGVIKKVNAAAASMMGYDPSYLVDRPFIAYVDSRYANSFEFHIGKVIQSDRRMTCELRVRRKDGVLVPVLIESIAGKDEAGESIIRAMVTDIGELWEVKERLEFEELLSSLSTRFIDVPSDSIDSEIMTALRRVIEFFQADRCAILEVQKDDRMAPVTHEVYAEGIEPIAEDPDLAALFPWRHERLIKRGEIVSFSRLDDLPPEAEQDRKAFRAWGVCSSLTIPVMMGNSTTHLISINAMREERGWSRDYKRLRLLAEVFINSLERKRKDTELRELKRRLETESIYLRGEMKTLYPHSDMIGRSDGLRKVLLQIEQVAPTDSTVLILGGSLGSEKVNGTVVEALRRLGSLDGRLRLVQVLHMTGQGRGPSLPQEEAEKIVPSYRAVEWVDIPQALAAADLVISRGGSSTVAEIGARGVPAIFLPWAAAATGEQELNVEPFVRAGAAVRIRDAELTPERLQDALADLLWNPEKLARMARASRLLGKPQAAETVAKLALELAGRS